MPYPIIATFPLAGTLSHSLIELCTFGAVETVEESNDDQKALDLANVLNLHASEGYYERGLLNSVFKLQWQQARVLNVSVGGRLGAKVQGWMES